MKQKARLLRKQLTDTERLLWRYLRNRQLGSYKFRRQEIIGTYIVDFLCMETRLIIEADGGQHTENAAYDDLRTKYLESEGYRILRFWNHEVFNNIDDVLEQIYFHLKAPHPGPLPMGEGITTLKASLFFR